MSEVYLSGNIKTLRKQCGLTQKQLAKRLGVCESTVSNYESGKHEPTPEMLAKIAQLFCISENCIINEDLRGMEEFINYRTDISTSDFLNSLCLRSSKEAMQNPSFALGYKLLNRIELQLNKGITLLDISYEQCIGEFEKCVHIPESAANIFFVVYHYLFQQNPHYEDIKLENQKNFNICKYMLYPENYPPEKLRKSQKIRFKYHDLLNNCICTLKASPQWRELGDFYFALQFIFNMLSYDLNNAEASRIGYFLMLRLSEFDNEYAREFIAETIKFMGLDKLFT